MSEPTHPARVPFALLVVVAMVALQAIALVVGAGWGVIEVEGARLRHVANGIIHSEGTDLAKRLVVLHAGLTAVIATHRPEAAAVEQTFVNKDAVATLKLGQARGIALLVPAQAGLEIGEYAPNAVKKAVVGVGHSGHSPAVTAR